MSDVIDASQWGGAQWVLVTFWITMLLLRMAVRASGATLNDKLRPSAVEWAGKTLALIISKSVLALVLAWGGFWA